MTTPTIVGPQYSGTSTDFLKVKEDRSGAARLYSDIISIPSGTAAASTVGLIPFNKGARFKLDSASIYVDDVDSGTTVTTTVGYVYDDNVTYTNNLTAWASSATTAQSGGYLAINQLAGLTFVAQANGWVVLQILAGPTTTTGNVSFDILGSYDGVQTGNQNTGQI